MRDARVYVTGQDTLLGRSLLKASRPSLGAEPVWPTPPNLRDAAEVEAYFAREKPIEVIVTDGRSGGIAANQRYPADLMLDNLLVASHVLPAAHRHNVPKLLYVGSSCSYPRDAAQPVRPEALMTGPVEPTSESYAVAKIAGLKLCQAYRKQYRLPWITAIPANLFGPGDDFSPEDSHVIGALIRRMHEAKERGAASVPIWGNGAARREFLYAPDAAEACLHLLDHYDGVEVINIGTGTDLSIRELAEEIREVVGFRGDLHFDASKPEGAPRKALDGSALAALGWRPRTPLREALAETYRAFLTAELSDA
jgi:GDP-L-fucose synthase